MFVNSSSRIVWAFATFLVACSLVPNSNALNMSSICALLPNGEMIASGSDCGTYYSCSNGVASQQTCAPGNYFNKDAQLCQAQDQVNCINIGQEPCVGITVGKWISAPNSCSQFYYCGPNGPQLGTCPSGELFDMSSQSCTYGSSSQCLATDSSEQTSDGIQSTVNICAYVRNNIYFGSPFSCSGWNICVNNVLTTGTCTGTLEYNVAISQCDYASDVICSQVTNDNNLIGMAATGGTCTVLNSKIPSSDCEHYYLCNKVNYVLTQCANGYYFDTISSSCLSRMSAVNTCDRCMGTTLQFVNSYSTGCHGYLYCQNGVESGSGTCPNGSYFNEEAGSCSSIIPPFTFCTTNAPTSNDSGSG